MNRVVLLLNVIVLLVNFLLSLSSTDTQIGLLEATGRAAGFSWSRGTTFAGPLAMAYLRVSEALESALPPGKAGELTAVQRRALLEAVEAYYEAVGEGVATLTTSDAEPAALQRAGAGISKDARVRVERILLGAFPSNQAARLATEVIRSCR